MNPQKEILTYQTIDGKQIFLDWLRGLKDRRARLIIRTRLNRLACGLAGKCEPVGQGVFELKIYYGPGYRIYFGQEREVVIILLNGGDKSSQELDIEKAKFYWQDYKRRIS